MSEKPPLVSVLMTTYNHENYLVQAIEGVLMQQTNFPFELVIGEDCSLDRTRDICLEYQQRYPEKVRIVFSETNLGPSKIFLKVFPVCRGKYIAGCDGDDYWTDPNKLQAQVDFLEANPEYGLVYTDILSVNSQSELIADTVAEERRTRYSNGAVFFELLSGNFINASTAIYKKEHLRFDARDDKRYWFVYDYWRWLMVSMHTKVHFMNTVTCHYRVHQGGVSNMGFFHKKRNYHVLYNVMLAFHESNKRLLDKVQQIHIFKKILSLLYRKQGTFSMKWEIFQILPYYFPGLGSLVDILGDKLKKQIVSLGVSR